MFLLSIAVWAASWVHEFYVDEENDGSGGGLRGLGLEQASQDRKATEDWCFVLNILHAVLHQATDDHG